jgi:hypothetical protein
MLLRLWAYSSRSKDPITSPFSPMTPAKRLLIRRALTVGTHSTGLTLFEEEDIVDLFHSAGQDVSNVAQRVLRFVVADRRGCIDCRRICCGRSCQIGAKNSGITVLTGSDTSPSPAHQIARRYAGMLAS